MISNSRTIKLMRTVRIPKVVNHDWDDGTPMYNTPERIEAAEELANEMKAEALSTLQDFFVEGALMLNTRYKERPKGASYFMYPNEIRRLSKALLRLGGDEGFNSMIMDKLLPTLEKFATENLRRRRWAYLDEEEIKRETKIIQWLQREFGSIGDWTKEFSKIHAREKRKRKKEVEKREAKQHALRQAEGK